MLNYIKMSGDDIQSAAYPGDLDSWVHIVYVIEANYNRRIYRNGVKIAEDTNTDAFAGVAPFSVKNRYVDVSDLRVYNKGLTAAE
jgi:hypothetical protein